MASSFSTTGTRLDRKALKRPDGFFKVISGFFAQLSEHTYGFVAGIVILLVLGIAAGFWMSHSDAKTDAARNALFLAEKSIETELKAIDPAIGAVSGKNAKPGDDQANLALLNQIAIKKLDVDAQFPESIRKLKAIDQDFSRTRPAFEARLKIGSLYYDHGDFTKALPWFEKAANSAPTHYEKALAWSSVGYTYESLSKFTEAVQAYQKAVQLGEGSLKGDLLLAIARSYDALHDSAKARSTYDQILTELPGTDYSKSAELYKSWIQ